MRCRPLSPSAKERTWRVQGWFDWDGYRVTPVIVAMDGTSLGKLAAGGRPEHDGSGRVPPVQGVPVVRDAFAALADVHDLEITHRALQLRSIEVTPAAAVARGTRPRAGVGGGRPPR